MLETLAYFASVLIGITLGLIGGGGSILTVPVLVYLSGLTAVTATAYSLFIVGTASLVGSLTYFKKGLINLKTAIVFGIPSILAVFLTRLFVVPAIPEELFAIGNLTITKDGFLMVIFSVLMILASVSMIRKKKGSATEENVEQTFNYPLILIEGVVVGFLTGLVGAGGGFLIIPALAVLSKLPMKMAVGTSLLIIALKSLIGFSGDIANMDIDWSFLIPFTAIAIVGIFVGSYLTNFIEGKKLKPVFGWFVLVMGVYILGRELLL